MANNIAVSVTADIAGLQSAMNLAKVSMQDYGKAARAVAREIVAGDTSKETAANFLRLSEAEAKSTAELALYRRELARAHSAGAAANDNVGQMRAGFQNLGFQVQDVAVQMASGQRASTIFAQQLPQVAGALTQIAQAGGNTAGVLGRFATFMSGPWGIAVGVAAAVLPPLIAKLFETGDAADVAAGKIYGLRQAIADMRTQPAQALGKLQDKVSEAQGALNAARNIPIQTGSGEAGRASAEAANAQRERTIKKAEDRLAKARADLEGGKLSSDNYDKLRVLGLSAGRAKAMNIKDDQEASSGAGSSAGRRGRSGGRSTSADDAAREAEAANQQIEALAEDRYETEAQLAQIALRAKLEDIEAEQRAGEISTAQAIEARANVNAQIAGIDNRLQARLFSAKLDQLEADRKPHKEGTAEYIRYTQQIELLQAKHLNRQLILDRNAQAQQAQARKQAEAAEKAELQRAEEQKRASLERTVGPFAQTIARMLTLQRGFIGTLRDLWGNMVNIVEMAVARMVQSFIIGLFAQDVAAEASHRKKVILHAKEAASGAYKAVVGIPIIGPVLAPIAAAAAFAGVMAFSAEDGWDVPGGGGGGIDGKGGRPAIIHPREMVLPAQIADTVRALPNGIAGATLATASLRGANAAVGNIGSGTFSSPRINSDGTPRAGNRRARGGGGASMNVTIKAIDARSFERFAKNNRDAFGKAVKQYARMNGRG